MWLLLAATPLVLLVTYYVAFMTHEYGHSFAGPDALRRKRSRRYHLQVQRQDAAARAVGAEHRLIERMFCLHDVIMDHGIIRVLGNTDHE